MSAAFGGSRRSIFASARSLSTSSNCAFAATIAAILSRSFSSGIGLRVRRSSSLMIVPARCVVIEEGFPQSGVAAEVGMRIMEAAFDYLDAPVARVTGKDVPMPYAANLEKLALPTVAEVVGAAKAVCYR